MTDDELEIWVGKQQSDVTAYLRQQGIESPNVGPWPAFEMAPHFAIWAVESKIEAGRVGWWAFSGDCPTDYVSEDGNCHPRNSLRLLLERWRNCIPCMKAGIQPPNMKLGDGSNLKLLGELLETRVGLLNEWFENDSLWEDR